MALDEATRRREEDPFTDVVARGSTPTWSRTAQPLRGRPEPLPRRVPSTSGPTSRGASTCGPASCRRDVVERSLDAARRLLPVDGPPPRPARRPGPVRRARRPLLQPPAVGPRRRSGARRPGTPTSTWAPARWTAGASGRSSTASSPRSTAPTVAPARSTCGRTSASRAPTSPGGSTSATRSTGCALALELKKTFMDEWTDEVDRRRPRRARATRSWARSRRCSLVSTWSRTEASPSRDRDRPRAVGPGGRPRPRPGRGELPVPARRHPDPRPGRAAALPRRRGRRAPLRLPRPRGRPRRPRRAAGGVRPRQRRGPDARPPPAGQAP